MRNAVKRFGFVVIWLFIPIFSCFLHGQGRALIIIDIQEFYFPGGDIPLEKPEIAAENAALLLDSFRKEGDLVLYIRHNYEPGGLIYSKVQPMHDEMVLTKNEVNAFMGTGLDSILVANSITDLILCGMQTHMCLEAATRAASDLSYKCTVIEDACATRSLKYDDHIVSAEDVHYSTLAALKSYADIQTTSEFLSEK